MTKRTKSKQAVAKEAVPAPGALFAVPLGESGFGACRVLRGPVSPEEILFVGESAVLVAASAWTGTELPTARTRGVRTIYRYVLRWPGQAPRKVPFKVWVKGPPPDTFVHLGQLPPTGAELAAEDYGAGITWDKAPHWEFVQQALERRVSGDR